jgi:hypothetical protein
VPGGWASVEAPRETPREPLAAGPDAAGRDPARPQFAPDHRATSTLSVGEGPLLPAQQGRSWGSGWPNSVIPRTPWHPVMRPCSGQRGSWAPRANCASAILAACASGILTRPGTSSRSRCEPWRRLPCPDPGCPPAGCRRLASVWREITAKNVEAVRPAVRVHLRAMAGMVGDRRPIGTMRRARRGDA